VPTSSRRRIRRSNACIVGGLHLVKIVVVLDWKHYAGPLMGNGFSVAGDFYNIDGV
jgi:hypothetical protein